MEVRLLTFFRLLHVVDHIFVLPLEDQLHVEDSVQIQDVPIVFEQILRDAKFPLKVFDVFVNKSDGCVEVVDVLSCRAYTNVLSITMTVRYKEF